MDGRPPPQRGVCHGRADGGLYGNLSLGGAKPLGYILVPVAFSAPPERKGELGIALASPDRALDEIDAASQVGEPGRACEASRGRPRPRPTPAPGAR